MSARSILPRADDPAVGDDRADTPRDTAASSPASPASPVSPASPDNGSGAASPALLPDRADSPELPLTMTASTALLSLPRDATAALAATAAGAFAKDKVVVRFKAVGSAPALGKSGGGEVRRKITATQKFEVVVAFVRRALRVPPTESVFLYVNSAFAPALDEVVGNLHQCFKDANDQLNVSYSMTPAFG